MDVTFEEKLAFKHCNISGWQKTLISSNILCKILDFLNPRHTKTVLNIGLENLRAVNHVGPFQYLELMFLWLHQKLNILNKDFLINSKLDNNPKTHG